MAQKVNLNPIINEFTKSLEILNRIQDSLTFDVSVVSHQYKIASTNKSTSITKFKLYSELDPNEHGYYMNNSFMFRGGEAVSFYYEKRKYSILESCDILYHYTPGSSWNGKIQSEGKLYINSECPNFFSLFNKSNEKLKNELLDLSNVKWLKSEDMKKFPDWVKDYLILK